MTDIIEQAARVIDRATSYTGSALSTDAQQAAQALADAGLLREPERTVPTREQIADAVMARDEIDVDYLDRDSALKYADAVLGLLREPAADGARPWEHEGHKPVQHRDGNPPWCHECGHTSPVPPSPAQQIRGREMSAYTPTTEQVREWVLHGFGDYKDLGGDWFDRWLQQVKAEAWEEGAEAGFDNALNDQRGTKGHGHYTTNPYRTQDGK